jgi:hypothetical protein
MRGSFLSVETFRHTIQGDNGFSVVIVAHILTPPKYSILLAELAEIQGGEEGADGRRRGFLGLAFHNLFRAGRALARRASRTYGGRGAFHFGATRARAGGAFAAVLSAGGIIHDDRLGIGNGTLEDVLGKIGGGRALGLQHVIRHLGASRRGWHGTLEDVFAHVGAGGAG